MKKLLMMVVAAIAATMTFAETYTWTGGTGSFKDPSKWTSSGGGVPVEGSDLAFPAGDNVVTDVGTLTVNAISLGGNVELQYGTAGGTFTVNGVISGSGSLTSTGNSAADSITVLKGDNTFTGDYWNNGGRTQVGHANALGRNNTAYFRTNNKPSNCLYFSRFDNTDRIVKNNIVIGRDNGGDAGSVMSVNSVNAKLRLQGQLTLSNTGKCAPLSGMSQTLVYPLHGVTSATGTGYLVLEGGLRNEDTHAAATELNIWKWGKLELAGPVTGTKLTIKNRTAALVEISSSNNVIGNILWDTDSAGAGMVKISADNPFANPVGIYSSVDSGTKTLDLNGHDVSLSVFYAKTGNLLTLTTPAEKPATLTLTGDTADRSFTGTVTGPVTLEYDCAGHGYALTGNTADMTGGIAVKAGTVSVSGSASLAKLTSLEVANEATLTVASGCALPSTLDTLTLGLHATLDLPGSPTFTVGEYWVVDEGGTATRQPGDSVYVVGNVTIVTRHIELPTVEATWTAGGESDTSLATAANWNKEVDLSAKNLVATFASAGSVATASDAADFKGLVFNAPSDFSIVGIGPISTYEEGIVASGEHIYTVGTPFSVMKDQAWSVGAGSTLAFTQAFGGDGDVFVTGGGTLSFTGSGGTHSGNLVLSNASTVVRGKGLGTSDEGTITLSVRANDPMSIDNVTINRQMDIIDASGAGQSVFQCEPNSTNVFNGCIRLHRSNARFIPPAKCEMVYAGGLQSVDMPQWTGFVMVGEGRHIVTNTPVNVIFWTSDSAGDIHLAVGGNTFGEMSIGNDGGNYVQLHIEADNAFSGKGTLRQKRWTLLDLHGHDLQVDSYQTANSDFCTVKSDTMAVLYEDNSGAHGVFAKFEGGASFKRGGTGTTTLNCASPSTGTVECVSGTLAFGANGSWVNANEAIVTGGTLSLAHGAVFGKKTNLRIATGATLNLNFDGVQTVGDVFLGESTTPLTIGDYGALDNAKVPAANRLAAITGAGVLHVRGRRPGMFVIVK